MGKEKGHIMQVHEMVSLWRELIAAGLIALILGVVIASFALGLFLGMFI